MVANNLLEIYTLLFGWNMYEAIWDVLVGSGLALIPFVAAVITNFRDNYEGSDAESTIKGLEIKVVSMILVLMLCVIPYKGWEIDLATVKYDLEIPDCNPPANTEGTGDNTATSYDDAFADMGGLQVYKPVAWSFVEFLSSAITHTTISSMSCANNYEFMLMRIGQITIQNPELRERVRDFNEVCYKKAIERYHANPIPLAANISPVQDVDWIGSRTLLNAIDEYYQHPEAYMRNMERFGFNRQAAIRDSDAAHETGAHPYCREVWLGEEGPGVVNEALGLRQLILDDIPVDEAGDILDDWMDWGSQVLTVGVADDDTKEDLIIKMILQADSSNLQSQTQVDLSNNFDTNDSTTQAVLDAVFSASGFFTSIDEWLQSNTMKQMVKIAGPMILALIQMVVIMASPFVLLLGQYRFSAFLTVALSYFSFEFINAIWAAAFWFDNRVLDIYASNAGWFDSPTTGFLLSAISAGSTILLPGIWLSIMAYAGAGMVRGMGMGGVGGGSASGSGSFRGASGRAGGAAYRAYRGRSGGKK
ncbi:MAG: hypothetical protein CMI67_16085 [Pelagibaca sp.]|nr:hypothetical protein [Pelagibaca sp.]